MDYLLALLLALGLLVAAAGVVLLQARITGRGRVALFVLVLMGGIATDFLLSPRPGPGFTQVMQQVLEWTYSALTMFAGAGSIDVVSDLVTPSGVPVTWAQGLRYFFQVLAFLLTISAVVSALARGSLTRGLLMRVRHDEVFVLAVPLSSPIIGAIVASPRRERRRLVVLVAPGNEQVQGVLALSSLSSAIAKLRHANRAHVIVQDSGAPAFLDDLHQLLDDLRAVGPHLHVTVVAQSARILDNVIRTRTEFDVRVVDSAELVARDLVRVRAPHRELEFDRGQPSEPFRCLVVADGGLVQTRVIEHLVMNSQFLDATPELLLVTSSPAQGTFKARHPEYLQAAQLTVHEVDADSVAFYDVLESGRLHQVVVALEDHGRALEIAGNVLAHFRHGTSHQTPRILVRGDAVESALDQVTFFGGDRGLYSVGSLVEEDQDGPAKGVNAFYHQLEWVPGTQDPRVDAAWSGLSYVNRASSRASAAFLDAMRRVWDSTEGLAEEERRELLARTEHLRWNAFYRMLGYRVMAAPRLRERFGEAPSEHCSSPDLRGRYARDDDSAKEHLCLVDWADLPAVDDVYNSLDGVTRRRFQDADRDVVKLLDALPRDCHDRRPAPPAT
jgi:hypothetical protein